MGSTRWLASSRSSAISPKTSLAMNAGMGKIAGRYRTEARVLVKSAFLTGLGDATFTGPWTDSCATT